MHKRILAIIPARGGSKRLVGKNIIDLNGKPLIAWSIEAGLGSKYVDDLIVSTEDKEIAKIAKEYGAEVPFVRPYLLSLDETSSMDVVLHAVSFMQKKAKEYDYIMLLQPTSPLRDSEEIDSAVELLFEKDADAVISVCKTDHTPLWSNTLPKDLNMSGFLPKQSQKRSQELPEYYRLNGAIYIADTKRLLKERTFFLNDNIYAYIMPSEKSVDIDTKMDLLFAETLMKNMETNLIK
jgi:CMP-N-acetylneuraminic acid synthetase